MKEETKAELSKIRQRINDMKTEREKIEREWTTSEQQIEAPSYTDNDGKILYNAQTEQSLAEQYVGRMNNQLYFDIKPDQQADSAELFASKKILDYFLEKENFYTELSYWDYSKAIYGMGIFYTGLTVNVECKYREKEWEIADPEDVSWGLDDDSLFEEYKQYNWEFTPKNVRVWDFYRDNRYFWQNKRDLVEDCCRIEYVSKDKLEERWKDDNRYDIEWLCERTWEDKSTFGDSHRDLIKLEYYYNKNNKDYVIIGNEEKMIRSSKMKYKSWKLPFVVAQHYPDHRCICGKGIPRKTRASKAYKNNMIQAALDKTWNSSFANIVLGKNNILNNRFTVWGNTNIWEFNSTADFQQFQTDWNISWLQIAMEMMNQEIAMDTWEDLKSAFDINPQEKLGQTEIKEENKAIRVKTISIARDIALDDALTFTYQNIQQFAPALLRKEVKVDNKTTKVVRPVISLPWITVKKEKGKQLVEKVEDYGEYGYYELNPKYRLVDWIVRIVTNSTHNKPWSVLEKNKFTEMIQNYTQLAQIYWPEFMQKVPVDNIVAKLEQSYWYDPDMQNIAKTKRDKTIQKNIELIEETKKLMWWGWLLPPTWWDETTMETWMGQPTAPTPWIEMWGWGIQEPTWTEGEALI